MKIILAILLFFSTAFAFGQTKKTTQKAWDSLFKLGKYDELIQHLDQELKKYPKSEDLLRSLGYAHIAKNNLALGEKYYLEALTINPGCDLCYMNIGRVYILRNDQKKALEYFNKAVDLNPKNGLLYANRAKLNEAMGDQFRALRDYNKAIEFEPANADYYVQRAMCNKKQNYTSLAITDLSKAIDLMPNHYSAYFERASLYYDQKRYEEALQDINKAIQIDSSQFFLYNGRGAIYEVMQETKKAISDYSKAISLNPDDYLPYMNRASAYYKLENMDAACEEYRLAEQLIVRGKISDQKIQAEIKNSIKDICDSSQASYYYQRGVACYNLKDYEKALHYYNLGLKFFPQNAMMLSFKGNAYLGLEDFEKAVSCYTLSLKYKENILNEIHVNPRFTGASKEKIDNFYKGSVSSTLYSAAECRLYMGKFDEALPAINEAIELMPAVPDFNKEAYHNLRGRIYLAKGKYEQAMSDFDKSIALNQNFVVAYVNRAIAKISAVEKVKSSKYFMAPQYIGRATNVGWAMPGKSALKKSEANLLSALEDCNAAIDRDVTFGFAFYVRGQAKKMLMHPDYCIDFLTAKNKGISVEEELLLECK